MGDYETPEPERTVQVERAHLLRDQVEYSEERVADPENELSGVYHEERIELTEDYLHRLETKGLREQTVTEMVVSARERLQTLDQETEEAARVGAKRDMAIQIGRQYFDQDSANEVDLGEIVASSELEGGVIRLIGEKQAACLTLPDGNGGMREATVDLFLRQIDHNIDDLRDMPTI